VKIQKILITVLLLALTFGQAWAVGELKLQKVAGNSYAIVGDLGNRTAANLGNNATFGFVITSEGVVLIDSGGSYQGAQKIEQLIKTVTDKPVVAVINTGGQDHRWLGNGYFKKLGAQIIASDNAVNDQKDRTQDQLIMLGTLVGDKGMKDTEALYAEKTFTEELEFKVGATIFKAYHAGQAHTPGDCFVWLPKEKVMFTGDIVYIDRMLGVGSQSNSKSWISVYRAMAKFKPEHLVPGHGPVTNLEKANRDTLDYLTFLRSSVSDFMEGGGDITDISNVKQDEFNYLLNFETLSGRNAQQVYTEMEWE